MPVRTLTRRHLARTAGALTLIGALSLTAGCGAEAAAEARLGDRSRRSRRRRPRPVLVPWPLTGVAVEAPPQRPAFAVKVENSVDGASAQPA